MRPHRHIQAFFAGALALCLLLLALAACSGGTLGLTECTELLRDSSDYSGASCQPGDSCPFELTCIANARGYTSRCTKRCTKSTDCASADYSGQCVSNNTSSSCDTGDTSCTCKFTTCGSGQNDGVTYVGN
jgi:hypothetical protein